MHHVSVEPGPDQSLRVALHGEIDATLAGDILREIRLAIDRHLPRAVQVDLSEVTFIDTSGLATLVHAGEAARGVGAGYELRDTPELVRARLRMAGLASALGLSDEGRLVASCDSSALDPAGAAGVTGGRSTFAGGGQVQRRQRMMVEWRSLPDGLDTTTVTFRRVPTGQAPRTYVSSFHRVTGRPSTVHRTVLGSVSSHPAWQLKMRPDWEQVSLMLGGCGVGDFGGVVIVGGAAPGRSPEAAKAPASGCGRSAIGLPGRYRG